MSGANGNGRVIVPDSTGFDLGWRAGRVDGQLNGQPPVIRSARHPDEWPRFEPMTATCHRSHEVPDEKCRCGLYSAKTLQHLLTMPYHVYEGERDGTWCVIAEVAVWGPQVPGTHGWRSLHCYPQRVLVPYELWELAEPLGEAYGVQTILFNFRAPKVKRLIDAQKGWSNGTERH